MAVYTENYNLILPEGADPYDVEDYNENFRAIDGAFSSVEDALAEIDATLDSMTQTLDALAGKSSSAVKSIQTFNTTKSTGQEISFDLTLSTVNPSRCLVIMTRMNGTTVSVVYTLYANKLSVKLEQGVSGTAKLQFQIVEFY
ncbi:MAG: hypothetical protein IKU21_03785 [Anaerotignum sp.]|nr:hypothetical protein [Anaerotignum sp.]